MPKWRVTTFYSPATKFHEICGRQSTTVDVEAATESEALSEAITATYEQLGWDKVAHVCPRSATQIAE